MKNYNISEWIQKGKKVGGRLFYFSYLQNQEMSYYTSDGVYSISFHVSIVESSKLPSKITAYELWVLCGKPDGFTIKRTR